MAVYDFHALSSDEFELLARDLIQEQLQTPLELFAVGRDEGIDFRGFTPDGELIGQCKHYLRTGLSGLLSKLRREREKVIARNPARYLVATTVSLTPANKDEIRTIFAPHITSTQDVLGQEALNDLLTLHPEIERRHFKLWLTSVPVLQRVLLSGLYEQSETLKETLASRMRVYVPNPSFGRAEQILREHRVCIIAGIPGIGKTMLAEMLIVSHIADGYSPVVVSRDIHEANQLFEHGKKQIFYYDDFLGQAGNAEKELNKNEDARLSAFVERIARHKDKRFVMTTREYILADVKQRYEKLAEIDALTKCVINIEDYSRLQRAKVLFNHLYFGSTNDGFRHSIVKDRSYRTIIDHKNYNPRLVEKVIELADKSAVQPDGFVDFFLHTLNHPARLWKHAVDNLAEDARSLLIVLASLQQVVRLEELETAFASFVGDARSGTFDSRRHLNALEGTFIRISAHGPERSVAFFNPSVHDYVLQLLNSQPLIVSRILQRATFFDQPSTLFMLAQETEGTNSTAFRNAGLRATLRSRVIELLDALLATLTAPSARNAVSFEHTDGSFVSKLERTPDSRETRLAILCDVASEFGLASHEESTRKNLLSIANDWRLGRGDRSAALALLERTAQIASLKDAHETLAAAGKDYLCRSIEGSSDVERVLEFHSLVGTELSSSELHALRGSFAAIVRSEVDTLLADEDDPDNINSARDSLAALAAALDSDIENQLEKLDDRRNELEAARDAEHDDYEDKASSRSSSSAPNAADENAAIDRLFSGLVTETDTETSP